MLNEMDTGFVFDKSRGMRHIGAQGGIRAPYSQRFKNCTDCAILAHMSYKILGCIFQYLPKFQ